MKAVAAGTELRADPEFASEIRDKSGQNLHLCYQCQKCASGCPARDFMDGSPALIMRYAQLGLADKCMQGNTVWYCSSCQTCSTRCPQGIDIAHVIDTIRIIAQARGRAADTKGARTFNFLWMQMLRFMGRAYELGIAGGLNLLSAKPFKDMGLGMSMLAKGKMKILPTFKRPIAMLRMFRRARGLER